MHECIRLDDLEKIVLGLKSEDGENPEYDRALAEMLCDARGFPMDRVPAFVKWLTLGEKRPD